MKIKDFSLKTRLLAANFLMIFIPVCLLLLVGGILLAGVRLTGSAKLGELSMLWPEKGPALSVQYAASSLRLKMDKEKEPPLLDLLEDCRILETQGINTLILKDDKLVYITPGIDSVAMQGNIMALVGAHRSLLNIDDHDFTFYYKAQQNNLTAMAVGKMPSSKKNRLVEEYLEGLVLLMFVVAVGLIILLGVYLSRLLSKQIIEPLSVLRKATSEVQVGNLDTPMKIESKDELGETCLAFGSMRIELKGARDKQEKYEQNRKELIADISHDLSTPLTSLKGYASGILDGIASTPEKRQHYVQMIYNNACSMEKLVESLFLFSKFDLGQIPFHLEKVSIYDYFKDFTEENQDLFASRGMQLELAVAAFHPLVSLDRLQFQRVVDNLLANSLKYKKGDSVHVRISLAKLSDKIQVNFSDDGMGVQEEELPKLFDSFYRTDAARTNVVQGSGLGLAIVKQIIIGMHGNIWAQTTPGGGLTICFSLPIAREVKHAENIDH